MNNAMKRFLSISILLISILLIINVGCNLTIPPSNEEENGDTTNPTVNVTNPTHGMTIGGSITIAVTATDNVGIQKVEFYIDGTKIGESTVSPYEWIWNTNLYDDKSNHSIMAKAYDTTGNVASDNDTVVLVDQDNADTTDPIVNIFDPSNDDTVDGTITIKASAIDNDAIQKVEFYIDDNYVGEDLSAPYEYDWNTTAYSDGSHDLMAKAYDDSANSATDNDTSVNVDNSGASDTTDPVVNITSPSDGATVSGSTTITASASDDVSVNKVEFYIDNTKVGEDTSSPYQYSWNLSYETNGSHNLKAIAYDSSNNSAIDDDTSVTVTGGITVHAGPWLNPIEGNNPTGGDGDKWPNNWTLSWTGNDLCDATYDSAWANDQDSSPSTLGMTSSGEANDHGGEANLWSGNGATIAYYGSTYDPSGDTVHAVDASSYNYIVFYAKFTTRDSEDSVKVAIQDKYGRLMGWTSVLNPEYNSFGNKAIRPSSENFKRVIIPFESIGWYDASGDNRNPDKGSIISFFVAPWPSGDELALDDFFFAENTDDPIPSLP